MRRAVLAVLKEIEVEELTEPQILETVEAEVREHLPLIPTSMVETVVLEL
jgi:hypothetical protein